MPELEADLTLNPVPVVIGTIVLLSAVIVIGPFVLCCCSRKRERDDQTPLLESNVHVSQPAKKVSPVRNPQPQFSPTHYGISQSSHVEPPRKSYGGQPTEKRTLSPHKPSRRSHGDPPLNRGARGSHHAFPQRRQGGGASNMGLGGKMDRNREALGERKEKLSNITEKTSHMEDEAGDYATLAELLAEKYRKKSSSSKKEASAAEAPPKKRKHKWGKLKWGKKK